MVVITVIRRGGEGRDFSRGCWLLVVLVMNENERVNCELWLASRSAVPETRECTRISDFHLI
jgi:hypothetical protein